LDVSSKATNSSDWASAHAFVASFFRSNSSRTTSMQRIRWREHNRARWRIGEGTVRTHLRHVFAKLAVRTRAGLAAVAARRGI
jgi:hypothetical protein